MVALKKFVFFGNNVFYMVALNRAKFSVKIICEYTVPFANSKPTEEQFTTMFWLGRCESIQVHLVPRKYTSVTGDKYYGTHGDERTVLYKIKSLNGTKPNTNPNTITSKKKGRLT